MLPFFRHFVIYDHFRSPLCYSNHGGWRKERMVHWDETLIPTFLHWTQSTFSHVSVFLLLCGLVFTPHILSQGVQTPVTLVNRTPPLRRLPIVQVEVVDQVVSIGPLTDKSRRHSYTKKGIHISFYTMIFNVHEIFITKPTRKVLPDINHYLRILLYK